MSTNRKTKKYDMLERQGGVALLVHDFSEAPPSPSSGGSGGGGGGSGGGMSLTGEYSITLNGTCSVMADGETWTAIARVPMETLLYSNFSFVNGPYSKLKS